MSELEQSIGGHIRDLVKLADESFLVSEGASAEDWIHETVQNIRALQSAWERTNHG